MTDIDNIIWIDTLWLDTLWDYLIEHQNCLFYTASGLPFSYTVKRGKNGKYNKELIIDRRTESKTLSFSSIRLAYENATKLKGQIVERPKSLGDIRGVSYIYPILYRMGVIEVPEKVKEKMGPR